MLVLSRREDQAIQFVLDEEALKDLLTQVQQNGEPIVVTSTVLRIKGNTVRQGIEAPKAVRVIREELGIETDNKPKGETVE